MKTHSLYDYTTPLLFVPRLSLRRPVFETLPLFHTLLPASRSETDLCSNCLVPPFARSVLRCEHCRLCLSIGFVFICRLPFIDWLATIVAVMNDKLFLFVAYRLIGFIASMHARYTISLRSSAGLCCSRFRQHCVAVGSSEQESVESRCETAAFVSTHSFNGFRCCPKPPFAITSFANPSPPRFSRTLRASIAASFIYRSR